MNTILPVRCYTCGKVIGHLADKYDQLLAEGKTTEEAMDELKLIRYCCRMNVFNPIVLPRSDFDHAGAFMDTTVPKTSIVGTPTAPESKVVGNKIALTYHTIVPGELKQPKAGAPKLIPVEEEILLEEPVRLPAREEDDDDLPPVRRVPKELPGATYGGPKKKVLLAR